MRDDEEVMENPYLKAQIFKVLVWAVLGGGTLA
jgi:hypothetical protein